MRGAAGDRRRGRDVLLHDDVHERGGVDPVGVTMMAAPRPLPNISDPDSAPFWAALRERRIELQRCDSCGYVRWPCGPRCPECLSLSATWTTMAARGTIWSHVVYHRAFHPAFAALVPYRIAQVQL